MSKSIGHADTAVPKTIFEDCKGDEDFLFSFEENEEKMNGSADWSIGMKEEKK